MRSRAVILPLTVLAFAACSKAPKSTAGPLTEAKPRVEAEPSSFTPASTTVVTPDPVEAHRAQLLAHIDKLNNSDCDTLVLQFQIIPRDEILDPISAPKKELLRYVKRIASAEELDAIERAIKNLRRPSAEELDAMNRSKKERER